MNFNVSAFIKAWVAQSVKHQAANLKVVALSPTVGKNFHFVFVAFDALNWEGKGPFTIVLR